MAKTLDFFDFAAEPQEEWAQIKNPVQLHVAALLPKK